MITKLIIPGSSHGFSSENHDWTNRQVVRLPQSMLLLFVYLASVNQNRLELTRPMEGVGTQGLKAHGLTLQDHKG